MSKVAAILRAHELARQQKVRRAHTHVETITPDQQSSDDYAAFKRDLELDSLNFHPDPIGRHREPKSIYSPAPQSRVRFERPAKRKAPERTDRDCEIPDYRRRQTFTIEDSSGRARGAIQINSYSKRIAIGGFGLTTRKP
ncbi:hypothetical protein [Bradyrhizobium erythrophlei]|uniref:Uncharacterized protein n=1 Tax=Bradyrhizobium erythrophlei TaxID=1437360 RepID=A0A1M5PTF2_9BRAD|nr:hypothetical protein [Bradyrhizobium erythrophlei]SHH05058.1 hypothetical protein SAMN05443248_3502 [Bradyrhizobium erythrophlei]